jgi:hypothetical protein
MSPDSPVTDGHLHDMNRGPLPTAMGVSPCLGETSKEVGCRGWTWRTPVIPATRAADVERSRSEANPGEKSETLTQKQSKLGASGSHL